MVTPAARREAVAHLRTTLGMSERRACAVVGADRTSMRYRSCRADDGDLRARLRELAGERRRFGYRRLHVLLRRDGLIINRKKTQRLYREEGLTVRRRRSRRGAVGARAPAPVPALPNQRWSLDFVHDQLTTGRRFRVLNIARDVTRECLRAVVDTSISGRWVVRELTDLVAERGRPGMIVSDRRGSGNGPGDRSPEEGHQADLERGARLVGPGRRGLALHRAWQAHPKRLRRELQRPHARRASQRDPVLHHRPGPGGPGPLGRRLQHRAAPLLARPRHPGRLRRRARPAAPRPRPGRRLTRAPARQSTPASGRRWSPLDERWGSGHFTPHPFQPGNALRGAVTPRQPSGVKLLP